MKKRLCYLCILAFVLLLNSCNIPSAPSPVVFYTSLNADGSGRKVGDKRIVLQPWGKPYYISDDLVLHVSNKIYRRALDSNVVHQLYQHPFTVTDQENIALDYTGQQLFFSARNHIYRCDFSGWGLEDLSPSDSISLMAPELSDCKQYLTAIRAGRIARLDLQSREWLFLEGPDSVYDAVYHSSTDQYYYIAASSQPNSQSLWSWDPQSGTASEILSLQCPSTALRWGHSFDKRYIALNVWYNSYSQAGRAPLKLYDTLTGTSVEIEDCFSFCFDPSRPRMFYSRRRMGMADLNLLDLDSGLSSLVWDGITGRKEYAQSILDIYVRGDGEHLFVSAWSGYLETKGLFRLPTLIAD